MEVFIQLCHTNKESPATACRVSNLLSACRTSCYLCHHVANRDRRKELSMLSEANLGHIDFSENIVAKLFCFLQETTPRFGHIISWTLPLLVAFVLFVSADQLHILILIDTSQLILLYPLDDVWIFYVVSQRQ